MSLGRALGFVAQQPSRPSWLSNLWVPILELATRRSSSFCVIVQSCIVFFWFLTYFLFYDYWICKCVYVLKRLQWQIGYIGLLPIHADMIKETDLYIRQQLALCFKYYSGKLAQYHDDVYPLSLETTNSISLYFLNQLNFNHSISWCDLPSSVGAQTVSK